MQTDIAEIRPKLKKDSIFIQTDTGIFFKTEEMEFTLKGKSVYRWVTTLAPHMTGETTVAELCEGLGADHQNMVTRLVSTLLQRGVIKNHIPESDDLLLAEVREQFAPQIEFIDHYADRPLQQFKTFRDSQVLLVGAGQSLTALTIALLTNGLARVTLAVSGETERYRKALDAALALPDYSSAVQFVPWTPDLDGKDYDVIAYCADSSDLSQVDRLFRASLNAGAVFLPAVVFNGYAIIGPISRPEQSPCWLCGLMRFAANAGSVTAASLWQQLYLGAPTNSHHADSYAIAMRLMGNGLGLELFKILTGCLPSVSEEGMIFQDLETLEATRSRLVAHPLCPICSQQELETAVNQARAIVNNQKNPTPAKELLDHHYYFVNSHVGLFTDFGDEGLSQLPLKTARILGGGPASPAASEVDVVAFSLNNLRDARDVAFLRAISHYSQAIPDKRTMRVASYNQLKHSNLDALPPQTLLTWAGAQTIAQDREIEWLPVYSTQSETFQYVPAAAAYPFSEFNRMHLFERVSAGLATGFSFAGVLQDGIISALAFERIRKAISGQTQVLPLETATVADADPDLDYLLKSAARMGVFPRLIVLGSEMPVHVVLAQAANDRLQTVGYGRTATTAVTMALLELVGQVQMRQQANGGITPKTLPVFPAFWLDTPPELPLIHFSDNGSLADIVLPNEVLAMGWDILFANITPPDVLAAESLISGMILLAREANHSSPIGDQTLETAVAMTGIHSY